MHEEQPMPLHCPGVEGAHDLMIKDLFLLPIPRVLRDATIDRIKQRKQVGLERYGQLLCPEDGRDTLRDAMEESLDLCAYLRNLLRLGLPVHRTHDLALMVLLDLVRIQAGLSDVVPELCAVGGAS